MLQSGGCVPHPAGHAESTASSFQRILDQLAAEHEDTVSELRDIRARCAQLEHALHEETVHWCGDGRRCDRLALAEVCQFSLPVLPETPRHAEEPPSFDSEVSQPPHRRPSTPGNLGTKSFKIKEFWLQAVEVERLETAANLSTLLARQSSRVYTWDELPTYNGILQHFISYPSSPARVLWDVAGAALILYDLFTIPLLLAFQPAYTGFLVGMEWFTLVVWTCDIFASLLVGYVKDGVTHMSPKEIAVRYARTWLAVGLLVVVPDWCFTLTSIGQARAKGSSSVKLIRAVRLLRMLRLLRLFKFRRIVRNLDELVNSEYVGILTSIGKMMMLLLVTNHYISCIWYVVGTMGESASWVREHGSEGGDWVQMYLLSFHWGICQFTPASMHVQPQNKHERVYAINVVIFAMVGFAYLVGSITGSLTQLHGMQENTSKQFWLLRCYMKQNRVSFALAARVHRYLEHAWKSQKRILTTDQIPLFGSLSDQLRSELQCEIYVPQLSVHPLLRLLKSESSMTMYRLANDAISRKVLALNDTHFIPGENATHLSFIRTGSLQYTMRAPCGEQRTEDVQNTEDWVAEPVLWMSAWMHVGSLVAKMDCELLLVDPARFADIIYLNPPAFQVVSRYAQNFAAWAKSDDAYELSDICQGEAVLERVMWLMGCCVDARQGSKTKHGVDPLTRLRERFRQRSDTSQTI